MSRFAVEVALHWVAVGLYIIGTVSLTAGVLFEKPPASRWARWAILAGLLPHAGALGLRWHASGHGPYMLRYEVLSANGWLVMVGLLGVLWFRPRWSVLGVVAGPIGILAVALAVFANAELRELPPTFRSVWLVFHIVFAKISAVAFLLSLAAGVLTLLRLRPAPARWLLRVPEEAVLDALVVRFAAFGWTFWTVTIAAGAIWANQSWGRYWGWDAIETWSLVSWLVYGAFLHARRFFRAGPAATAWMSVGAFGLFVLTAIVLPFLLPSIHSAYFQ